MMPTTLNKCGKATYRQDAEDAMKAFVEQAPTDLGAID